MRSLRWVLAAVLAASATSALPADAQDVPAYGAITISNNVVGGLQTTNTYEEPGTGIWDCGTSIDTGAGGLPTVVTVTCTPHIQALLTFNCPNMVLTAATGGGTVGGTAQCNGGRVLDTGVLVGFQTSVPRSGNLGHVTAIVCRAYVDNGVLVPPYTVTCNEPGAPTL